MPTIDRLCALAMVAAVASRRDHRLCAGNAGLLPVAKSPPDRAGPAGWACRGHRPDVRGQGRRRSSRRPSSSSTSRAPAETIAMEYVSRSTADGTTLFFAVPAVVTNPFFQKASLDPSLLIPVIQINSGPFLLLVNPGQRATSRSATSSPRSGRSPARSVALGVRRAVDGRVVTCCRPMPARC